MWIRKINPDSKIIAILRDPIDRAVSDFEFQTRVNKSEKRTFSQAINDDLNGRIDPNHKELVLGNLSTPPADTSIWDYMVHKYHATKNIFQTTSFSLPIMKSMTKIPISL